MTSSHRLGRKKGASSLLKGFLEHSKPLFPMADGLRDAKGAGRVFLRAQDICLLMPALSRLLESLDKLSLASGNYPPISAGLYVRFPFPDFSLLTRPRDQKYTLLTTSKATKPVIATAL